MVLAFFIYLFKKMRNNLCQIILFLALSSLVLLQSCKKDPVPEPDPDIGFLKDSYEILVETMPYGMAPGSNSTGGTTIYFDEQYETEPWYINISTTSNLVFNGKWTLSHKTDSTASYLFDGWGTFRINLNTGEAMITERQGSAGGGYFFESNFNIK